MGDGRNLRLGALRQRGRIFWFALVASISWAVAASPFGCGLDDTAITQFGTADGSADGTIGVGEGGPIIGDGGADVVTCTPETCNNYPSVCRSGLPNNCGGTVDCTNACPSGQACIPDSGTCDGPPVCHDGGAPGGSCGELVNPGNGLDASCGGCTNPGYTCAASTCTCAAGGTVCGTSCCSGATPNCSLTANTCCKMKTCSGDYPGTCNSVNSNGCGGNLDCSSGTCGAQVCDTTTHNCCTPATCASANACNTTITNGCDSPLPCTACPASGTCLSNNTCCNNKVCNGICCTAAQTECMGTNCCDPDPTTTTCGGGKCGVVNDNCGVATNCPGPVSTACADGNQCFGPSSSSTCTCGTATCTRGQTCHIGPDHCS